jgi:hypothetical protein
MHASPILCHPYVYSTPSQRQLYRQPHTPYLASRLNALIWFRSRRVKRLFFPAEPSHRDFQDSFSGLFEEDNDSDEYEDDDESYEDESVNNDDEQQTNRNETSYSVEVAQPVDFALIH